MTTPTGYEHLIRTVPNNGDNGQHKASLSEDTDMSEVFILEADQQSFVRRESARSGMVSSTSRQTLATAAYASVAPSSFLAIIQKMAAS